MINEPSHPEQPQQYQQQFQQEQMPMFTPESNISNIVGQIDPTMIVDNLNHSLKGEFYDKERGMWVMNPSGVPLVNDSCRGFIISYVTAILNNNSVMAIITQQQLGYLMESIIEDLGKEFVCNLENLVLFQKVRVLKIIYLRIKAHRILLVCHQQLIWFTEQCSLVILVLLMEWKVEKYLVV